VHANIVLLDEINRSSAKSQSAMLEAMEERQTTIAGQVHPLADPFLVIATQNPVDQEGTYPLSEAQTDRFLLKEIVRYPSPEEEVEVMSRIDAGIYDKKQPVRAAVSLEDVLRLQEVVRHVYMDRALMLYASKVVDATRHPAQVLPKQMARLVEYGASPRATIAFCKAARARAVLAGRAHVLPEDIAKLAHRVLRHRLILGFEAASAEVTPEIVIDAAMRAIRVP
jgi:MoxR-like ATPase